jgi:tetratricopeptide (TPR) repeat protein
MFHLSTTIYMEYIGPDPFGQMEAAARAAQTLRQAGAARELVMSEVMLAYAQARLGSTAESLESARRASECAARIQESMATMLAKQAQAFTRALSDDPRLLEEGQEHALSALECASAIPFYAGMTRSTLGRILFKLGRYAEAEAECRQALGDLEGLHMLRLGALTALVHLLLRRGNIEEALARAEEGLQSVRSAGSAGGYEVPVRLAVAEARHAAGDMDGARSALRDTLDQIQMRADKIEDTLFRERYLSRVHENVRARELARAWGQ